MDDLLTALTTPALSALQQTRDDGAEIIRQYFPTEPRPQDWHGRILNSTIHEPFHNREAVSSYYRRYVAGDLRSCTTREKCGFFLVGTLLATEGRHVCAHYSAAEELGLKPLIKLYAMPADFSEGRYHICSSANMTDKYSEGFVAFGKILHWGIVKFAEEFLTNGSSPQEIYQLVDNAMNQQGFHLKLHGRQDFDLQRPANAPPDHGETTF